MECTKPEDRNVASPFPATEPSLGLDGAEVGKYLKAAFIARPFGMPIPPNWLGLAAAVMLGALLHPGFWLIGAGLELAYLKLLTSSRRFRDVVDSAEGGIDAGRWTPRAIRLRPSWSTAAPRLPAI